MDRPRCAPPNHAAGTFSRSLAGAVGDGSDHAAPPRYVSWAAPGTWNWYGWTAGHWRASYDCALQEPLNLLNLLNLRNLLKLLNLLADRDAAPGARVLRVQ